MIDKIVRLMLYFAAGYVIGTALAQCSASAEPNERVVLTTTNTIVYRGVVTDSSVLEAQKKIIDLVIKRGRSEYTIYLVLDSPGGSIDAGLSFIEFAKSIRNLKTISLFSASMASAIVEALPGERLVIPSGVLMFHRAQGGFEGYFESGEVESRLSGAKQEVLFMENMNASRMKFSLENYKKYVQNELWLFGDKSVTYRAADRVVDVVCTVDLIKQEDTITLSGLLGMFSVSFTFSGCPLLRSPNAQSTEDVVYLVPSVRNYKLTNVVKAQ